MYTDTSVVRLVPYVEKVMVSSEEVRRKISYWNLMSIGNKVTDNGI